MMTLYDMPRSGNCWKVRLMLALLGVEHARKLVDLTKGENRQPGYLKKNPLGQVPTLDDDGRVIRDSQAILVYLAGEYGDDDWLPEDPEGMAHVMEWLSYAANEILNGLAKARAIIQFGREGNLDAAQAVARQSLRVLDAHLANRDWLAGDDVTIADVAVYPYVSLADEAGLDLAEYANVGKWIRRVEGLNGYVPMFDA